MDYILMTVAIIFAAANSIVLRIFKNRTFRTPGDVFFFNGGVSVIWTALMSVWYLFGGGKFSWGAVMYGGVYAVILCLFLYLKTEALAAGYAFFSERLNKIQIAGMLVGLAAIAVTGCSNIIMELF